MKNTTMNTGAASLSDERERAAITACALMIKGICLTRPNAEWTGAIEDRIQFMLKQMQAGAAIAAGGAQEPAQSWIDGVAAELWAIADVSGFDDFKLAVGGFLIATALPRVAATVAFQQRVQPWMMECFGPVIADDRMERNHRFFEEATELVQACGMTASEAHQLVDYTFSRPVGEPSQEVGGVMVTLAALCLANRLDMHDSGETELARINVPETVAKIRAKQAAKPKHSPLPAPPAQTALTDDARECLMDVVSHHHDFRTACIEIKAANETTRSDELYWQKQIDVLDRMKAQAERALTAAQSASGDTK